MVEIHICMLLKFIIKRIAGADEVGHALCAVKNTFTKPSILAYYK